MMKVVFFFFKLSWGNSQKISQKEVYYGEYMVWAGAEKADFGYAANYYKFFLTWICQNHCYSFQIEFKK